MQGSELYCVLHDHNGYIWFGGDRGVTMYNGYEFRSFSTKDGLLDNTVFKMYEDNSGRIWILTFSGRVFYYEKGKIEAFAYNQKLLECTKSKIPLDLYCDESNNVYLTIRDSGEFRIDTTGDVKSIYIRPELKLQGFHYYADEVTEGNFVRSFTSPTNTSVSQHLLLNSRGVVDTLQFPYVSGTRFTIARYNRSRIIFSIGATLYQIEDGKVEKLVSLPGEVLSLYCDRKGNVLAGSYRGLYFFRDGKFDQVPNPYLSNDIVTSVTEDYEGGYWFLTLESGAYYVADNSILSITTTTDLSRPLCLTIFQNRLFAGYWSGKICKINNGRPEIFYTPIDTSLSPITKLTPDPTGEKLYMSRFIPGYFVNGKVKLFKVRKDTGVKPAYLFSKTGKLYAIGSTFVMEVRGDSLLQMKFTERRVNCIYESTDGRILIGTNDGVYEYHGEDEDITSFNDKLKGKRVDDIVSFGSGIAFGTKGDGLLIFDGNKTEQITDKDGLSGNLIDHLLVHNGEIWCSTSKGISRIKFDRDGKRIENIHASDGLVSESVNDLIILRDTLYVASNSGISFFNINRYGVKSVPPPVSITGVLVNNKPYSVHESKELSHDQNDVRISFTGVSYRSRQDISYEYTLLCGKDTISGGASGREIEFLSLSPGSYSFKVSAINKSGEVSSFPAEFDFVVQPAYWQTLWFKLVILVLVLLLIFYLYRRQIRKVEERYEYERRQASLQLVAIRAQMNPHFIFNVMNSIRNYMQNHDLKSAEKYLVSFSKLVRYTLDKSDMQVITLEEEVAALKNYIELEMQQFDQGFDFELRVEEGLDLSDYDLPSLLLQPFVENSIKHGLRMMKDPGKLLLEIRRNGSGLDIGIEDNGVGISKSALLKESKEDGHKSRGMQIIFERIEAFNKAYKRSISAKVTEVKTASGEITGTRVDVFLD